jgi:hypothetical protein
MVSSRVVLAVATAAFVLTPVIALVYVLTT